MLTMLYKNKPVNVLNRRPDMQRKCNVSLLTPYSRRYVNVPVNNFVQAKVDCAKDSERYNPRSKFCARYIVYIHLHMYVRTYMYTHVNVHAWYMYTYEHVPVHVRSL